MSAACSYLVAKPSRYPISPRNVVHVYTYIESLGSVFVTEDEMQQTDYRPDARFISERKYFDLTTQLTNVESIVLRVLGFQTQVTVPHALCINYLQTLDVFGNERGSALARRAYAHLNSALCSPQLLYVTHQPNALATAAIYLAAKEVGVKLPGEQWWEVFDTDREELGFLVVALVSMEGFVRSEQQKWKDTKMLLYLKDIEEELSRRQALRENGND